MLGFLVKSQALLIFPSLQLQPTAPPIALDIVALGAFEDPQ